MSEYGYGVLTGVILTLFAGFLALILYLSGQNDYKDQLVVKYYNNDVKYERKMAISMVESSGVATNFVNKVVSMSEHGIEWVFTNPKSK